MSQETITAVGTSLSLHDYLGIIRVRLGIGRNRYRVEPGLYKVGMPERSSPVFVSANYKMSFDLLRKGLAGLNAWILVLNTRGINVWCAAGKGTFSTCEIIRTIKASELEKFVSHRELILPQLSAPGVAAHEVMKGSGFKVCFGPVRAADIKRFMDNGRKADEEMRMVTFNIRERAVLAPLELTSRIMTSFIIITAIFTISGIGHKFPPLQTTLLRGLFGAAAYLIGLFAGAVVTPLLLPWLPGRSFSLKGAAMGLALCSFFCILSGGRPGPVATAAMLIFAASTSSYAALTFTGATPFTSPTGVEKEMRRAMPFQIAAVVLSCGLWIGSAFIGR